MYESLNLNDSFEGAHSGWTQRVVQEGINCKGLLCSATAARDLELMHWLQDAQKAGPGTAAPLASPLSGTGASAQPHSQPGEPNPALGHSGWNLQKGFLLCWRSGSRLSKGSLVSPTGFRSEHHPLVVPSSPPSPLLLRVCSSSAPLSLPPSPVLPLSSPWSRFQLEPPQILQQNGSFWRGEEDRKERQVPNLLPGIQAEAVTCTVPSPRSCG